MKQLIYCAFALILGTTFLQAQLTLPCGEINITDEVSSNYIIPDGVAFLDITLRGADGGGGRRDGNCDTRREGGSGAEFKVRFQVGNGNLKLQPGGQLRAYTGRPGGEGSRLCSAILFNGPMGGGGGSTAILYLPPGEDPNGTNWILLGVAGGGGGGGRRAINSWRDGIGAPLNPNAQLNGFTDSGSGNCGAGDDDGDCVYPGAGYACDGTTDINNCADEGLGRSMVSSFTSTPFRVALEPNSNYSSTGGEDVAGESGGDAAGGNGFTGGGGSREVSGGSGGGFTGGKAENSSAGEGGTSYISSEIPGTLQTWTAGTNGGGSNKSGFVVIETLSSSAFAICPTQPLVVSLDANGNAQITASDINTVTIDDFTVETTIPCGGSNVLLIKPANINNYTEINDTYALNCMDVGVDYDLFNLVYAPNGTTVLSSCTFDLSVIDNITPTAIAQDISVTLDNNGNATISANDINNGSSDNCGISSLSISKTSFNCDDIGANIVTLTVSDNNNPPLVSSTTATVTVVDDTPSTFSCLNPTVSLDGNGNYTFTGSELIEATNDNCQIYTFISALPPSVDCNNIASPVAVSVTAEDGNGNQNTCMATVTVVDDTPPVVTCEDATVQLDGSGSVSIDPATIQSNISDNCLAESYNAIINPSILTCDNLGQNSVTFSIDDGNGLTASCTATVTVEDNIPPQPTCLNTTVTLNPNGLYGLQEVELLDVITDNCGGGVFESADPSAVSCTDVGSPINVTVTVNDGNGNTATCIATVTVEVASTCPEGLRLWTGAIDSDWNNPCNWSPTCVPTLSNNVLITNTPTAPLIVNGTNAFAQSVRVINGALTIDNGGSLTIGVSTTMPSFQVQGMVRNDGTITIDNTTMTDAISIINNATFDNYGTINIGQNGGNIGQRGINVGGSTFNHYAGVINIDNTVQDGIQTFMGLFNNEATINIGQNGGNIGTTGLELQGDFNNASNGIIKIGNTSLHAIQHTAPFENDGTINIGQSNFNIGGIGILIKNTFTNHSAGQIFIDQTGEQGIWNQSASLSNAGVLFVGTNGNEGNIGAEGMVNHLGAVDNTGLFVIVNSTNESILNEGGTITNFPCSRITLLRPFNNANGNEILNQGLLGMNTDQPSVVGNFVNEGIIVDIEGAFPTDGAGLVNNEIIVAPSTGDCNTVSPAFALGTTVDFNFQSFSLIGVANPGTYDLSSNTFTPNLDLGVYEFINIVIEDPINSCTFDVPWRLRLEDTTPPMPICNDPIIALGATGSYTLTADDLLNGGTDNCGSINFVSSSITILDCANVGATTPVIVTVDDGNSNTAECTAQVSVIDNIPPQPTCLNTTITLDPNGSYVLQDSDLVTINDNCNSSAVESVNPTTIFCRDIGSPVSVTVNVNDGNGNTASCTATITVEVGSTCPDGLRTWTGAVDSDWNTPCNWNPTCVPTINDDVAIPARINDPIISSNTAAVAKSVGVGPNATLSINTGSSLTIDGALIAGLENNNGTINNAGTINIDNTVLNALFIRNNATFHNTGDINIGQNGSGNVRSGISANDGASFHHQAGVISIDNTNKEGIGLSDGGSFTNQSTIHIGQNDGNIGDEGIDLNAQGQLQNEVNGIINIGNTQTEGLQISSQLDNAGQINIGQDGKSINGDGINISRTISQFNNFPEGILQVDNTQSAGFRFSRGTVNNEGQISIGQNGASNNIGTIGIDFSNGDFFNLAGGLIEVSNTTTAALEIETLADFNNNACAVISIEGNILNSGSASIINDGYLLIDTPDPSQISDFTNNGIIGDVQGSLPLGVAGLVNNEIIISPSTGNCNIIDPAFNLGASLDFNILGVFSDEAASNSAGNYTIASNVFTGSSSLPSTVYVQVEDPFNSCTRIIPWQIDAADTTPPIAVCFNPIVTFSGQDDIMLTIDELLDEANSSDNCGTFVAIDPLTVQIDCNDIGSVLPITVTIEDEAGLQGTCVANVSVQGLACGWTDNGGIGCNSELNTSSYDSSVDEFTLTADNCIPSFPYVEDRMAFVFTELCGDGEIIARVTDIDGIGYAGVTVRNDLTPGSPMVSMATNSINRVRKQIRVLPSYPAYPQSLLSYNRFWLRIVRTGNFFQGFASVDGVQWIPYISQSILMENDCIQVGLFTYSEKANDAITATFDNVFVTGQLNNLQGNNMNITLGKASEEMPALNIFPNPTSDIFTIDLGATNWDQQIDLLLFNSLGQQVRQRIDVQNTIEQMEVSDLETGVYNLIVKIGDQVQTKRLVIAR